MPVLSSQKATEGSLADSHCQMPRKKDGLSEAVWRVFAHSPSLKMLGWTEFAASDAANEWRAEFCESCVGRTLCVGSDTRIASCIMSKARSVALYLTSH